MEPGRNEEQQLWLVAAELQLLCPREAAGTLRGSNATRSPQALRFPLFSLEDQKLLSNCPIKCSFTPSAAQRGGKETLAIQRISFINLFQIETEPNAF